MSEYLDHNRTNFAFRRAVTPEDLRPFILTDTGKPRTEWRYSLKTTNRREALERCRVWVVKTDLAIRKAQAARDAWLTASAKSPEQRDRERLQWEGEIEASDLAAQDDLYREMELDELEPMRRGLIKGQSESPYPPRHHALPPAPQDREHVRAP